MDAEILHEIHQGLETMRSAGLRYTRQAFAMLPALRSPRILDVGCGPGTVTLELARLSGGQVAGLDIDRGDLQVLCRRIDAQGLTGQVEAVLGSMLAAGFRDGSFDTVWAEGSLHFMGFAEALRASRRLIKPGGFLVAHEMAWLRPEPPQAIVDRWQPVFPEISTVPRYLEQLPSCGYRPIGHFALPEGFWWENYYAPLQERIAALREKYAGEDAIQQILSREQREVYLYREHARWYGSAFVAMQRAGTGRATGQ
jgi:ubiquinone/menaquinone biosynthesis C-methylase UbiE